MQLAESRSGPKSWDRPGPEEKTGDLSAGFGPGNWGFEKVF
ncbi:MAG: hypothetical protein ACT6RN_27140 [Agrobacterium sp.]